MGRWDRAAGLEEMEGGGRNDKERSGGGTPGAGPAATVCACIEREGLCEQRNMYTTPVAL